MSQFESHNPETTVAEPETGRAELRRAAFLKAGREVFLEFGYEAANMAEIVRRAGGSLSTLYAQFGGKKGLFEAVIDSRVSELTAQMHQELAAHAPLREGLQRIGEAFLTATMAPESVDFMRLIIGQAKQFPEMAQLWITRGPDEVRKALAVYIDDRMRAGELKVGDAEAAASVYFDLIRSRMQFRLLLDPTLRASEQDVREAVDRAVKVFLGGVEALG